MPKVDLDALDSLEAKATPGPWMLVRQVVYRDAGLAPFIAQMLPDLTQFPSLDDIGRADDDGKLIVALRNAYPALRAYVKALEAERDASREVMRHQDRLLWLCEENTGEDIEAVRVTRLATDAARAKMEKQDG